MTPELRAALLNGVTMIVSGTDPYDQARKLQGLAMSAVPSVNGQPDRDAWAHWLIWGALTDWIEVRPAESEQAEAVIVEVAHGWLAANGDPVAESALYDHVIYEVCGYAKPWEPGPESFIDRSHARDIQRR